MLFDQTTSSHKTSFSFVKISRILLNSKSNLSGNVSLRQRGCWRTRSHRQEVGWRSRWTWRRPEGAWRWSWRAWRWHGRAHWACGTVRRTKPEKYIYVSSWNGNIKQRRNKRFLAQFRIVQTVFRLAK